jgi:hypothetical protein
MFKKRWIQRERIKAVYEDDLSSFCESIGILDEIKKGNLKCISCGVQITLENIGIIFSSENELIIACDSPICISDMEIYKGDSND